MYYIEREGIRWDSIDVFFLPYGKVAILSPYLQKSILGSNYPTIKMQIP